MLSYSRDVSLIRFIDNHLLPTNFNMEFHLHVNEDAEEDDICFALQKFEYWLDNHVTGSIAIAYDNDVAFNMVMDGNVVQIGNPLMITPEDPTDGHMLVLFASKLNAFASGAFIVDVSQIGLAEGGIANTIMGDPSVALPTMDEWIKTPNWFAVPWWDRDDSSQIDSLAPEDADLNEVPEWASSLDFLGEPTPKHPLIIPGDFEPKIVGD